MSKFGMVLTVVAALLTATANICLRKGLEQSLTNTEGLWRIASLLGNFTFVAGNLLYGFAMLTWLKILSIEPVGIAYPVLVGLTFVLLMPGAALFAHEPISLRTIAGTMLILAGITIVARS